MNRLASQPVVLLIALAVIWSAVYGLVKVIVETVPPFTAATLRLVLAGSALYAVMRWRGERIEATPGQWVLLTGVGVSGNALPFVLINWGEVVVDSGLTAILIGTVPLFTMVLAHFFGRGERLTPAKIVGIAVGLAGIVVLMGPELLAGLGVHVAAELAIVVAALSYGVSNVLASRLTGLPVLAITTATTLTAAIVSVPFSLVLEPPWTIRPSGSALAALATIGLLSTAIGNLLFFRIVALAGATFFSLCNYIVPVLSVVWGMVFLAEALSWRAATALVLILAGVATTNAALRRGAAARS
jgi:drug/metabolite transporter (DMT)-like permease